MNVIELATLLKKHDYFAEVEITWEGQR